MVLSLQPAPPQLQPVAPKRERGLNGGPCHNLGYSLREGTERGGTMPFHVSKRRRDAMFPGSENAQGQRGGTNGNHSKVRKAHVKLAERNKRLK